MRALRVHLSLIAAAALVAACSSPPTSAGDVVAGLRLDRLPTGDQTADRAALDSAGRAIQALAGSGKCADGACAALAVGAKPCGGPWSYVSYCPTSPDAERLRTLAAELQRAERAYNERYSVASTCDLATPPAACPVAQ